MSGLTVDSLFVAVGYQVDQRSIAKVEKQTAQMVNRLEKEAVVKVRAPSWRERRAEMSKEAMLWRSEAIRRQKIHERSAIESHGRIRRAIAKRREAGGFGAGLGLGGLAALGGGAALLGSEMEFDKQLTSLDVASRGAMGSIDQVRSSVIDASNSTGVAREEILSGASAFVRLTGDGKTAAGAMRTFGIVSKATGSDIDDVASTAAALSQQLGVSANDMEDAFSILIAGGKAGAIEMKDMAQFSAELASQFKLFQGGTGLRGLADMSAAFQTAAQSFGGKAPETATGLKALFSSFTSPRTLKALKQLKVDVFDIGKDGTAKLKAFPEIFEAMARTDMIRDPRLLTKVFESSEARRAASAILGNVDAFKKLSAEIRKAKDARKDFDRVSGSRSGKAESATNRVKNAAGSAANFAFDKFLGFGEGIGTGAAFLAEGIGLVDPRSDAQKVTEGQKYWQGQSDDQLSSYAATHADGIADMAKAELRRRQRERDKQAVYDASYGPGVYRMDTEAAEREAMLGEGPVRYDPAVGGGRGGLTTGNIVVTVNAQTTSDAKTIADMVTGKIRQALETSARDIAAAGGQ